MYSNLTTMKSATITAILAIFSLNMALADSQTYSSALSLTEGMLNVDIDFNISNIELKSCESAIVTPYLVNGDHRMDLESFGVYGRRAYIQHERGNEYADVPVQPAKAFKAGKDAPVYCYRQLVDYTDWFDGATLGVDVKRYGCAGTYAGPLETTGKTAVWIAPRLNTGTLGDMLIFVRPDADPVKVRELSGRANVEFQVNKTILLEDFRNNYSELSAIRASIDSVRNDKDVTINTMQITGYASPEGSYDNNVRLAKGRTEAVVAYVERLYALPKGFIKTSSDPEDWGGLKAWVENSNISHKEGILSIIDDTTLAPDPRDQKIKRTYPEEYAMLLNTVYPSLRHTDYKIEYTVRSYSDPKEILAVMKTRPGNLSLNEFFVAAQSLEPGSDEFNEVFDIAVKMYPENEIANLNAANSALMRRDLVSAANYLQKAGDSKEADLARGMLAVMQRDYDKAELYLGKAEKAGISQAKEVREQIASVKDFEENRKKK